MQEKASRLALQQREPELEDRVAALERAHEEADRARRMAQADVSDEGALAIDAETRRRQARIHELQAEIDVRLQEQAEHSTWISNSGPVQATRLRARARELRTA